MLAAVTVVAAMTPVVGVKKLFLRRLTLISSVRTYNPFVEPTNKLQPNLQVSTRIGRCYHRSVVDPRPDSFRCIGVYGQISSSGHEYDQTYDPCFDETVTEVICASNPWTRSVTRLRLTSSLVGLFSSPIHADPKAPFWAILLQTGESCVLSDGATAAVAGQRLNYICQDGSDVYAVNATTGTAEVQSPGASTIGSLRVLIVWR